MCLGAVDILTFLPLNVNWTFRSAPPPPLPLALPFLNVHFCCPTEKSLHSSTNTDMHFLREDVTDLLF